MKKISNTNYYKIRCKNLNSEVFYRLNNNGIFLELRKTHSNLWADNNLRLLAKIERGFSIEI